MFRLDNKTAVVTGAGSGIGRSIAVTFASQGAWVAALDRDDAGLAETRAQARSSGAEIATFSCDVSDRSSVDQTFAQVVERFAKVDVLVNNAGIAHVGNLASTDD